MYRERFKQVRGLQPGYISVVAETALQAIRAKIMASRVPFFTYDYAEAIDALISIMPVEIKRALTENYRIDVDAVVSEALEHCKRDPLAHPYVNEVKCLKLVKQDLDKLLRIVFDLAHEHGLFVLERVIDYGRE